MQKVQIQAAYMAGMFSITVYNSHNSCLLLFIVQILHFSYIQ